MWFLSDEGIDKKLGYLNSICNLDDPERITYLLRFKPKKLHEWIQLLREQENEERKLTEVSKKAQLLAEFIIKNPKYAKDLIWIIVDLLGRDASLFSTINLSNKSIEFIQSAISSKKRENLPYVILARYIQPLMKTRLISLILSYIDYSSEKKDYVNTGIAIDTLPFINLLPKDSMRCLARNLNHNFGYDGYPDVNVINSLRYFKNYDYIIVDEIVKYISDGIDNDADGLFLIKNLILFVNNIKTAKKLLYPVSKAVMEFNSVEYSLECDFFGETSKTNRFLLILYGKLQAIIHGDI